MITIIKAPIFCAREFLVLLAMNASHVAKPWRGAAFERRRKPDAGSREKS
jgi:hypothetical protein